MHEKEMCFFFLFSIVFLHIFEIRKNNISFRGYTEGMEILKNESADNASTKSDATSIHEEGDIIRKSRYAMAFPIKDQYLLINGLSGAVRLVSKETAQKFLNGEQTEDLKPFFTYLTREEEYEQAQFLCQFLMSKAQKCVDGSIAVTYDCSLRCPYCYESWLKNPANMSVLIDSQKVDKAFQALETLNKECPEKKSLNLTGGEPLMRKNEDIVKYILEKGDDLGYSFTMSTNGLELNHFLSHLSSVDIRYIQTTLDGPRSLHDSRRFFKKGVGTFDIIVKNIEEARSAGIPLVIRINSDPEIISAIDELTQFFRERGWVDDPNIHFWLAYACSQLARREGVAELTKLYKEILNLGKKPEFRFIEVYEYLKLHALSADSPRFWPSFWFCNAVSHRLVFDPFGDVYSCLPMLGWKEQRLGVYIPELSFNEKYQEWKHRTIFNLEKCLDCSLALVCGGGCAYDSLLNRGDLYSVVCRTSEEFIASYIEYLYERKGE